MKLSKILNELQQSSRKGTVNISAYDLIAQMEKIQDMGIYVERDDGLSPDGKTYLEFTVYPEGPEELDQAFTVYDYKFGLDPTDEDNFRTEYPFSLGARKRIGLINASNLGLEIESFGLMSTLSEASGAIGVDQQGDTTRDLNITNDTSMYDPLKENLKDLAKKSGMKLSDLMAKIKSMKDKEKDQIEKDAFKGSAMAEDRPSDRENKKGIGQLYVQPAVVDEIGYHIDTYKKGVIDVDDMIQAIEEILYGKVVAPGMREDKSSGDLLKKIENDLRGRFGDRYSDMEIQLFIDSVGRDIKRGDFDGVETMYDKPAGIMSRLATSFKKNPMPWIIGSSLAGGAYTAANPGEENLDRLMADRNKEVADWDNIMANIRSGQTVTPFTTGNVMFPYPNYYLNVADGGRVARAEGGIMDLGGMEKDYRETGGFVPIGEYEKKDDVPARLSLNEFVMTADAVRGAGNGDVDKGAEVMEDMMETLEAKGRRHRQAQDMFSVSERLSEVVN